METITLPNDGKNPGHYAPGIISKGMLYISGQLPIHPLTRSIEGESVQDQLRQALENMNRVLQAAGCSRRDVVQCRIYLADIEEWEGVNAAYAEFFGEHKPARTIVPSGTLHFGCLVEVEAVAEVAES